MKGPLLWTAVVRSSTTSSVLGVSSHSKVSLALWAFSSTGLMLLSLDKLLHSIGQATEDPIHVAVLFDKSRTTSMHTMIVMICVDHRRYICHRMNCSGSAKPRIEGMLPFWSCSALPATICRPTRQPIPSNVVTFSPSSPPMVFVPVNCLDSDGDVDMLSLLKSSFMSSEALEIPFADPIEGSES